MSAVKELHAQSEATFVKGAGDKVNWWWTQSGDSEAAKMKKASKERKSCDSAAALEEPGAKREPPTNPLRLPALSALLLAALLSFQLRERRQ